MNNENEQRNMLNPCIYKVKSKICDTDHACINLPQPTSPNSILPSSIKHCQDNNTILINVNNRSKQHINVESSNNIESGMLTSDGVISNGESSSSNESSSNSSVDNSDSESEDN